ncbi:uncharacterized protein [Euphorbia lathyris]|uniref:uncharacterized protein n=1 Tax=Euphorbia lathyris TaxID=212925 RepID=UPI00331375FD
MGKTTPTTTTKMEGGRGETESETATATATTPYRKKTHRFGEVAGGTAAECAAVCCCCPCTVVHLLVLTIFKMPVCLCRKAQKRHRIMKKKKKQRALLAAAANGVNESGIKKLEREVRAVVEKQNEVVVVDKDGEDEGEIDGIDHLENEMWDRFYSTGFWRSPSQRSAAQIIETEIECKSMEAGTITASTFVETRDRNHS